MTKTRASIAVAILCVSIAACWQALTVHYSYGGNWTALFCTGAKYLGIPPALDFEHVYLFADSYGYDGQMYHYVAHDPLHGPRFAPYLDEPRFRYRRILLPGLAYVLALGQDRWVDRMYYASVWLFVFLGAYWLSRFAVLRGYPPWLGLGFLLVPAVPISIDRMTVDITLAAFCAGFALYTNEDKPVALYAVLAFAALGRETGILLTVAYCLYLVMQRRFRLTAIFATAVLPAFLWYLWVNSHLEPGHTAHISYIPFSGLVDRLTRVFPYPFGGPVRTAAIALDWVALAGVVVGLLWAGRLLLGRIWNPVTIATYGFAFLAVMLTAGDPWDEVFGFGRLLTPLLFLGAMDGLTVRSYIPGLAMLALDPRIGLQVGRQILNVVRGVFS